VFYFVQFLKKKYVNGEYFIQWLMYIHNILNDTGLSNIWLSQYVRNTKWFHITVKQKLCDKFLQRWNQDVFYSSKQNIFEHYIKILSPKFRNILIKIRTTNHRLPTETGRWDGTPRYKRTCNLCNYDLLADEYHYLLKCQIFSNAKKIYLPNYFCKQPSVCKIKESLSSQNVKLLKNLSKLIDYINKHAKFHY